MKKPQLTEAGLTVQASSGPFKKRPGRNGGWLRSGNPGSKSGGRKPAWIREQLRRGLEAAMPMIRHALATRRDPLTGQPLSWLDFTRTVEVASRIALPPQQPFEDDQGITLQLVTHCDHDQPVFDPARREWVTRTPVTPAPSALPAGGDKTR